MSEEASEHERERERERESERASVQVRESEGGREVEKNDRYNVKVSLPWKCVCFPDLPFCMQVCFRLFGRRDRGTYKEHRFEDKVELAQHICKEKTNPDHKDVKKAKKHVDKQQTVRWPVLGEKNKAVLDSESFAYPAKTVNVGAGVVGTAMRNITGGPTPLFAVTVTKTTPYVDLLFFSCFFYFAATKLGGQVHQERTQVVCSNNED